MKNYIVIIISILLCSCSKEISCLPECRTIDASEIVIPNLSDSISCKYSYFVSSIEYIYLEDTEKSIISDISALEITSNGDLIVLDRRLNKIVRFDSLGVYLNTIGEIGHGPNELISPMSIAYDRYKNSLYVLDGGSQKMIEFALDGKVLSKYNRPCNASTMTVIDEAHYCFYSNYSGIVKESGISYNYHVTDREFNEIGSYEQYKTFNLTSPNDKGVFQVFNNRIICKSPISGFVFEVLPDSIKPLFKILYDGDHNWISGNADEVRDKYFDRKDDAFCERAILTDHFLILTINEDYNPKLVVYNIDNGEIYAGTRVDNDIEHCSIASSYYIQAKANRIYSYYSPENFDFAQKVIKRIELIDYSRPIWENAQKDESTVVFSDNYYKFLKLSQKINPTLQVCTLK